MERERNTNKFGQPFKTFIIDAVWEKPTPLLHLIRINLEKMPAAP